MRAAIVLVALALLVCSVTVRLAYAEPLTEEQVTVKLDTAADLIDDDEWAKGLVLVDEVLKDHPSHARALKLYLRANKARQAAEEKASKVRKEVDAAKAMAEVDKAAAIPEKVITNEPPISIPKRQKSILSQEMQELLNQRVSMNLIDADVSYILNLLFTTTGINIIASRDLLVDKRLDIHVENARLEDLLDYIAANAGVTYIVNESGIWITTPTQPQVEIRVFHLRYGVTRTGQPLEAEKINQATSASGFGANNNTNSTNNRSWNTGSRNYNPYFYRTPRKAEAVEDVDGKIDGAPGMMPGMGGGGDAAFRSQMLNSLGQMMRVRAQQLETETNPNNTNNNQNNANGEQSTEDMNDMEKLLTWMQGWSGSLEWPQGSSWRFDPKTNSIIVVSTPAMLDKIERLIEEFDLPPIQVNIRTRFITVKVQQGIEWGIQGLLESALGQGGDGTNNRTQFDRGSGYNLGVPSGDGTTGGMLTFRGVLTDPQYKVVMHALQTELDGRLLSEPNVTTLSNEAARLVVAEEYPYPTDWEPVQSTITNDGATTSNTTAFVPSDFETENIGITLDVMPSVGSDLETIILELHPSIVAHDPNKDAKYNIISTNADGDTVSFEVTRPTFARQEILAKVVIRTGETVVLGGLINEEDTTTVSKVPLLGDIPGLGALFRRTVKNKARSNLLIFVTAEIVDTRGRFYHPDGTETKTGSGRDILPDIMPTMPPANGTGNGTARPSTTTEASPKVEPKPDGTDSKGADWTPRDDEKERPTIKIERPKPARIGRKK